MQIGIEDSGDNLLTREIGSIIKGYALRTLQLMRMPILWWIGNAAWKALYDERDNPRAARVVHRGQCDVRAPFLVTAVESGKSCCW